MKHIYIDSRLDSLAVAGWRKPIEWIFSQGKPWLLLTPPRLSRLAARLGLHDNRVDRLLDNIRRHAKNPETFCQPLGIATDPDYDPTDYPPAICPECDALHQPHPLDAYEPCSECQTKEKQRQSRGPSPRILDDRKADSLARAQLKEKDPELFCGEELSPNWKVNFNRRLNRDWQAAINRVLTGGTYRTVAREFDCSVGLLHRKVQERNFWENN